MAILGVDLGTKRVGIAVSDELNIMAHPVSVLTVLSIDVLLKKIAEIIEERKVQEIVVGVPFQMNGKIGSKAESALEIVETMKSCFKLPVHLWDERLTTQQGERILLNADLSRKKRKRVIDALAAQILLQAYLDRVRETK